MPLNTTGLPVAPEQGQAGVSFAGRLENHRAELYPVATEQREKVTENVRRSPNCCMARSALQGSSSVMWTRRFWFLTRLSAWREIPELEASEIIATS